MPARVSLGFGQPSSFTNTSTKCVASRGMSSLRSLRAASLNGKHLDGSRSSRKRPAATSS